jgi:hypothetical protein
MCAACNFHTVKMVLIQHFCKVRDLDKRAMGDYVSAKS